MFRLALRPQWLALLALLMAILISFGQLGLWQLSRAQDRDTQDMLRAAAQRETEPLGQVLAPSQPFPEDGSNYPVEVSGQYDPDLQFVVPDRVLEGTQGWWVVTGLRTADGALLPVLRGWVDDPAAAGIPDTGTRTVAGTLAPGESAAVDQADLPPGQMGSINLATLANTWPPDDLYNAFIFATDELPPVQAGDVVPVPPPSLSSQGIEWRNLGYALQWWVFAGFAAYMYYRFLREAAHPREVVAETRSTVAP